MEEIDPIIRDLGASALRPQESYSCTSNTHTHTLSYKNMGLLIILTLVLMLASQVNPIWPKILPQLLAVVVSLPLGDLRMNRKRMK